MTFRGPAIGRIDCDLPAAQSRAISGAPVSERARTDQAIVYVVDDEPSIRNSTKEPVESVGLRVQTFATAQDFLGSARPAVPGCLVLDVRLPGLSGLDLQHERGRMSHPGPLIFMTGHGDTPMRVRARR